MPHPSTLFGEELRKRRLEAGLSLTDLSGLVHYSKAQLSKVERGIKAPSRDLARLCDAALGTDGALIALGTPTAVDSPAVSAPGRVEEENWMMQLSPDGPNSFGPVGRREVMNAGVASLMTWRSDGSGPASPAASAGMLEASRSLFTHYRRLGQTVEPGLLLPVLIAQTHTLRELSAQSDSATRRRLLALGSRYAEYVGWLVQETGDERAALWWTQRAVTAAIPQGSRQHALRPHCLAGPSATGVPAPAVDERLDEKSPWPPMSSAPGDAQRPRARRLVVTADVGDLAPDRSRSGGCAHAQGKWKSRPGTSPCRTGCPRCPAGVRPAAARDGVPRGVEMHLISKVKPKSETEQAG
ncbi:helix-turn-helix domain-containing protein [Streptomyces sp. NPDC057620]|uniref:helix-turn-helix domain-containing protein n=1 Tax=Streptomyces sp. NPDC057620 TaxID=3346185 RepID=UPI0036B02185